MFGFINLNKPTSFTSHDCIAKLRKLLNTRKIGHGGTLDPSATGVLPIAVGKATRLLQFLPESKAYRAKIRLGITTTTDDLEGEIIETANSNFSFESTQIKHCLNTFLGTIEQVPPIYSAIKKDGKKLYELARKGQEVIVEPRTVNIFQIELIKLNNSEFWELEVDIKCSPGTYIRAIARDLGKMLGVGGTLAGLVRTESCGMSLDQAITFAEIEAQLASNTFKLIQPNILLNHWGNATLAEHSAKIWCQGQLVDLSAAIATNRISTSDEGKYVVTYDEQETFLGMSILFKRNEILKIKPKIVCHN